MENFLNRDSFKTSQRGSDQKLSKAQSQSNNLFAQTGEVILESMGLFFNQAMQPQSLQDAGDLSPAFIPQIASQGPVTQSTKVKLTSSDHRKQFLVLLSKEIEAFIAAFGAVGGLGDLQQFLRAIPRVRKGRDKFQIAVIGGFKQTAQREKTVNTTFQRRHLFHLAAILLVYLPKGFKLAHIIDSSLNSQYQPILIVHFDNHCTHMVTNAGSQDPGIKIIADFALIIGMEFISQKGGEIVRFDRENGTASEGIIKPLKVSLFLEDQVRSIFSLSNRPVIGQAQLVGDRTVLTRQDIQHLMQVGDPDLITYVLGSRTVRNRQKSIAFQRVGDGAFSQFGGQPVMAVEIELEIKGTPGRYPQISQTQFLINKIEIILETFTDVSNQMVSAGLGVMPGLIAGTGFHNRKNMHQTRLVTALLKDGLDAVFFTKNLDLGNILYGEAILLSQTYSVFTYFFIKGFSPLRIIKDQGVLGTEERGHTFGIVPAVNGAPDDESVIAGNDPLNLVSILLGNQRLASVPDQDYPLLYTNTDGVNTDILVPACPG
jgi:hypothetical protein